MVTGERPILVVGCPRSGTTLLQVMLHAHPRIAIPPENRFVLPVYRARAQFGDLRQRANRERLATAIVGRPRKTAFRDLKLDADEVTRRIVEGPPTLGSAFGTVLAAYAERFDKPRWGDKRPAYIAHLDVLLRLFPDAQVVHIVRDGRDCFASLKQRRWWGQGPYGAVRVWGDAMRDGARARRRLRADQYHEVRYEDLVADPETHARRLCDFLDEAFDDAMLSTPQASRVAVPRRKRRNHHTHTREAISDRSVRRFADELEPWELELFERVNARWMTAHGYHLVSDARPPTSRLGGYARHVLRRRRGEIGRDALDWWRRRRDPGPLARQV